MNLTVIILAAGKGTRMKCKKKHYSKVAFPILGEPIVSYVLNAVKGVKPKQIVTIIGFGGDITKKLVSKDSKTVWQKEQKGTGHAVLQAKQYIKNSPNDVTLVLCGDAPLIRSETIKKLISFHIKHHNDQTLLSAIVDNPFGYGRIVRDNKHKLVKVVEETDTNAKEKKINEVNSGVVLFSNPALLKGLKQLTNNNAKGEYYLTQLISIFLKNKNKVEAMVMVDPAEMDGINDRNQLASASKKLQLRINKEHKLHGVKIMNINNTRIGPYVKIGRNTTIEPNVELLGHTVIGSGVTIGANSVISNAKIPNHKVIKPFSHIK